MAEVSVSVFCRFRPINTLERSTWEDNRLKELLKLQDLEHLEPQFHVRKNHKFQDPRTWKELAAKTKKLKKHFDLTPNDILRFQKIVHVDVSDWDERDRFLRENLGVQIFPEFNAIETPDSFGNNRTFTYDKVLWLDTSQQEAFQSIGLPMMKDAMRGINGTLVAFGQTGSGKTFSTFGPEPITEAPFEMLGLIPLSFSYLFEAGKRDETVKDMIVEIEVIEIYLGKLRDLLEPLDAKTKKDKTLKLREMDDVIEEPGKKKKGGAKRRRAGGKKKKKGGGKKKVAKVKKVIPKKMVVVGAFQAAANTVEDIQVLLAKSTKNRSKSSTEMNKSSSRSHLIMRAKILQHKTDGSQVHSYLAFCDLAGSEKVRKTNVVGDQLKEAKDINLQLSTLRDVIDSVVKKKKFIPFKNAMLTRVLKYSLVGNVKTSILVCCSPHVWNQSETLSALKFGATCKLIKNKVVVNKEYTKAELKKKIEVLEKENKEMAEKLGQARMKEFAGVLSRKASQRGANAEHDDLNSQIVQLQVEVDSLEHKLAHAEEELEQERLSHAEKVKELNRGTGRSRGETLAVANAEHHAGVNEHILDELHQLKIHMTNKHAMSLLDDILERADYVPKTTASRKVNFHNEKKDLRSIVQAQSQFLKDTMMNIVDEDEMNDDYDSDFSEFDEGPSAMDVSSPGDLSHIESESFSISRPDHGGIQYKNRTGQPTLSDPILDLVANLTEENLQELRTFLRSKRRAKGFELNFKSLNEALNTWKISDVAAFWVTLSCQQQKKVRIIDAMGFVSRLEHYLTKQFVAKEIETELGDHSEQFREVLSTIPSLTFSEIDLNGDDKIHVEELCSHLKTTQRLVVERLFKALDEDNDGFVSRMEFDVLKTSLEKDLSPNLEKSQKQKRFNFSELFNTLIPNLDSVYGNADFVDSNGGLTEKGASHVLHLLRNSTPGTPAAANDLGLLYLVGLSEKQLVDLIGDVPQQIWHQLVEHPEEN